MLGKKIDKSWLKKLYQPPRKSHKGDNGVLLIIAGSKKYHGSLILSATMAAKIVDLVYVSTTKENFSIISKLRERLAEFIYVNEREREAIVKKCDAVLVGPGLLPDDRVKRLVTNILRSYPEKKIVLDAGALRVVNLKLLHKNCLLTPHGSEFQAVFKKKPTPLNAQAISLKYPMVIVLKAWISYICQKGRVWSNTTGNQGMTKGGTGDVLAGLMAALLTKNAPLTAAGVATYVNGLAGDELKKKCGFYYSASELIPEVQRILKNLAPKSRQRF